MRVIKCNSLDAAYRKGIEHVINNGIIKTCHGTSVCQADEVTLDINLEKITHLNYGYGPLKQKFNESYCAEFLDPTNPHDFTYTYGQRIARDNQLEYLIAALKFDKTTRQAVMSLWYPKDDQGTEDPPCMNHIHVYQNTSGKFTLHLTMRSNDFYNALYSNMLGVYTLIKEIEKRANITINNYIHTANCPHIYNYELDNAESYL